MHVPLSCVGAAVCMHKRLTQPAVENLDGQMEVFVCGQVWEIIPRLIFSSIIKRV